MLQREKLSLVLKKYHLKTLCLSHSSSFCYYICRYIIKASLKPYATYLDFSDSSENILDLKYEVTVLIDYCNRETSFCKHLYTLKGVEFSLILLVQEEIIPMCLQATFV